MDVKQLFFLNNIFGLVTDISDQSNNSILDFSIRQFIIIIFIADGQVDTNRNRDKRNNSRKSRDKIASKYYRNRSHISHEKVRRQKLTLET